MKRHKRYVWCYQSIHLITVRKWLANLKLWWYQRSHLTHKVPTLLNKSIAANGRSYVLTTMNIATIMYCGHSLFKIQYKTVREIWKGYRRNKQNKEVNYWNPKFCTPLEDERELLYFYTLSTTRIWKIFHHLSLHTIVRLEMCSCPSETKTSQVNTIILAIAEIQPRVSALTFTLQ